MPRKRTEKNAGQMRFDFEAAERKARKSQIMQRARDKILARISELQNRKSEIIARTQDSNPKQAERLYDSAKAFTKKISILERQYNAIEKRLSGKT